jgi:ubiquinone biosynthesis protein
MLDWIAHSLRLARAAITLASYDALLPKEYRDRLPTGARWMSRLLGVFARVSPMSPGQRLERALRSLGPGYIKFGQFLSSRSDLIGKQAAKDLSKLKDRMPAFSREEALDAVNDELGATETLFGAFSDAVAAASVAQVHKALLPEGGTAAVKVLRPRIERKLARDMAAFAFGAKVAERFSPKSRRLRPKDFVATVAESVERELDLRLEAGGADEFREVAARDGYFHVPRVDWTRSGKRVLTIEWIDGAPLTDIAAIDRMGADRKALAQSVIRGFLAAALDHGFFHADMHEGNIIYGDDGKLWLVDFGIMGRLGTPERRFLAQILLGFLRRDYLRIAEVHIEAGYVPQKYSAADFAQALRSVGEPIFGKTADQVSMGRLLLQLFDVTHLYGMQMRPELILLQKTMVQMEAVARTLDPEHDLWEASRPIVERWAKRELGPEGISRRLTDEALRGVNAVRKLPDAVAALEQASRVAALRFAPDAQPRFPWLIALAALVVGAVIALIFRPA